MRTHSKRSRYLEIYSNK